VLVTWTPACAGVTQPWLSILWLGFGPPSRHSRESGHVISAKAGSQLPGSAAARGQIPTNLQADENLVGRLSLLFRTLRGRKVTTLISVSWRGVRVSPSAVSPRFGERRFARDGLVRRLFPPAGE
jgi:hypothetical protein